MRAGNKIYPVYLLYGPEDYLIEQEVQKLLDGTLSEKERRLNLHVFDGEEKSGREIVQAAQTLPMFCRFRFILIKGADKMDEDGVEALSRYCQNPSPSTCLVLCAQTLGPWKGHRKEIEKTGVVVEYARLKGKALVSWMKNRMAEKGKALSDDAAECLAETTGDNLTQLENALEQVYLSVGEKKKIDASDVEGIVSEIKVSTVFDLTDAIGQQNVEKALVILAQVLETKTLPFRKEEASKVGDPIPLLLTMMARQYRLIWKAKKMVSGPNTVEDAAKILRTSPWMVKKMVDQGRNFSEPALREGILKCHRTDVAIKRGRGPKELLMEKLVIDLCHPEKI